MPSLGWTRTGRSIFVGGEWIEISGSEPMPAVSPIDEQVIGRFAAAGSDDVDHEVAAITPALEGWAGLGSAGRVPYLRRFAEAIARFDGLKAGYYVQPTLFSDVTEDMRVAREEIFGPVVALVRYEDDADAVRIANDTEFGLTSRVISDTLDHAARIGRQIKAGTTLLNTADQRPRGIPFGGYKESGLGKQACLEEVLSYTEEKSVVSAI